MMRSKFFILFFIAMLLWFVLYQHEVMAQAEMVQSRLYDVPTFHYDLVNVASPDPGLSRLQVYLKIAFDELQFTISDEGYLANYEVSVVIYDKKGNQIDGKIEDEEIKADNFDLTNSRQAYSTSYLKFDLEPGEYKISISLADLETRKKRTIKDEFRLKKFDEKKLMVSDLALVRNVVIDSLGVKSFRPDIANCIKNLTEELYVYFEIYSQIEKDEQFQISYTIKDLRGKEIIKNSYKRRKDDSRTLEFFSLATSEFSQGKYLLEMKVKSGLRSAEVKKPFFIRWAHMPATISDIDLAIRQLKYIADKKEFDELKKATPDDKLQKFEEFWRNHDPTPGTETNEGMDEFYKRVQFTDENFTVFRDGWKSDMGMIYIIFGPPSDIERHPFDLETKPHEIWFYHDINKQFVFMDLSGFGEYRLLTTGWEAWRSSLKNPW
ncbi:MAG: GWxTD domain-containing protein [bacterium]|nr:MAG: GWxTD domain-containing protein [bacterium]